MATRSFRCSACGTTDRVLRSYETPCQSGERGDERGPQQTPVIKAHAPIVFGQANIDQLADFYIAADRLGTGDGEIVVLHAVSHVPGDTNALPNEKQPDGQYLQF